MIESQAPLLLLDHVSRTFETPRGPIRRLMDRVRGDASAQTVHAVNDVTLQIDAGDVVGLVGESGCGKSTLGRLAAGIIKPNSGRVLWQGQDLATLSGNRRRTARRALQLIFQDPFAALNPRLRVQQIIGEGPLAHGRITRAQQADFVVSWLNRVGLGADALKRYPHQFSGGQRARIGIARALAMEPQLLICDESVASLDVSVQAQVLTLLMQLRHELGLACLFISHDLAVIRHVSDRVAVMYLGRIVEQAPTAQLFSAPHHPYTQGLLAAAPTLVPERRVFTAIRGEIPSPLAPPTGCAFHPRCPHVMPRCKRERPLLRNLSAQHTSACHLGDA